MASSKKYDVFLSFRGEDTRYGITGHIYRALDCKKIKTYIDDKCLERGEEITPALLAAIEASRISVVVFSKDYASSSWCLSELVQIHRCRQELGQVVLPIFFEVDPSHVRKQDQGSYRDSFNRHEKNPKHTKDTIKEWRSALEASANLSGSHYSRSNCLAKIRTEPALVEDILNTVLNKLNKPTVPVELDNFDGLIGMENHFRKIKSLLMSGTPGLQIIGIWGMPGVGKTTIAETVSSRLFTEFESHYFLKDVRESSERYGLERLRNEIIARLLGDEKLDSASFLPSPVRDHAKDRLRRTKVLLILDDISGKKQLEYLIGDHIGNESRVIITTRDESVLRGTNIAGATFNKYGVDVLSLEEALVLFHLKTDEENPFPEDYVKDAVEYVGRNPLAIKVFGSHLRSMRNPCIDNWKMELDKLKEIPHNEILEKLKISYDALGETEQKIFLDIACFFKGMKREFVESILNKCDFHGTTGRDGFGLFANIGIDALIDKSLITLDGLTNSLDMHDLMQQMGWEIVRRESEEPGNRSRLWNSKHAYHVFENDTGSALIEGIFLDALSLKEHLCMKPRVFQKMKKLRLLSISSSPYDIHSYELAESGVSNLRVEALECFPESLRYLKWEKYPLKSLPMGFSARYLVELKFIKSQLEQLWNGTQELVNLKSIDLTGSEFLRHLPDFSLAPKLEVIILNNCSRLLEVPLNSFGKLDGLSYLDLSYCNIWGFLESIDARSLKTLLLQGCPNLTTLPWIASTSLVTLDLSSTPIADVPLSIGYINTISKLKLRDCKKLVSLPQSISQLNLLETLDLGNCDSLDEFPELPTKIMCLSVCGSAVKEVPSSSIEGRSRLREISLSYCTRLESLPESIFDLVSLVHLNLLSCDALMKLPEITKTNTTLEYINLGWSGITCLPSSIGNLTNLKWLQLSNCRKLESVGDLCGLQLTLLTLSGCMKIQRISELPYTLKDFSASGCKSLEEVVQVSYGQGHYESTRNRFWHRSLKVTPSTFDITRFDNCWRLNQRSQDNIITAFQIKVLHMASHDYAAAKCEVETPPAVTAVLPGSNIPYCFEFQCEDSRTESILVTVPLPADWHGNRIMGFALCTVYHGNGWNTDVYCKIEFKVKDKASPETTAVFSAFDAWENGGYVEASSRGNVVMWYKHYDYSHLHGRAVEASFRFWLDGPDEDYQSHPPTKCGVHILRAKDLKDMDLIHSVDNEIRDRKRPREEEWVAF